MDDSPSSPTIKDRVRRLVSTRLERSERILAVLQIGLILTGGFAAGIAQIMLETKDGAMPWREILGYGGAAFALVGGSLLWWLQYSAPEELNAAFAAVDQLESDRRMHDEKTSELTQLFERAQIADDQRAQLAVAVSNGISIVDEVIAADIKNLKKDVEQVLTACLPGLLAGMGLSMADNYCISVFERRPFRKTEKKCSDLRSVGLEPQKNPLAILVHGLKGQDLLVTHGRPGTPCLSTTAVFHTGVNTLKTLPKGTIRPIVRSHLS